MTSALGVLPALFVMLVLFGVPPLLSMLSATRRAARLRARLRPDGAYRLAALGSAAAFLFNMIVLFPTAQALNDGGAQITWLHWVALALSWLCFWSWVVINVTSRRRRRVY
jgi:TctA family transporter